MVPASKALSGVSPRGDTDLAGTGKRAIGAAALPPDSVIATHLGALFVDEAVRTVEVTTGPEIRLPFPLRSEHGDHHVDDELAVDDR
jgi:hypothetical protein